MFRYLGPGQVLFAAGMAALGALCLAYHDFLPQWQAVPRDLPARELFALACGALLVLGSAALLFARSARLGAALLALLMLACLLLLRLPQLASSPLSIGSWEAVAETVTLAAAGWLLWAWLDTLRPQAAVGFAAGATAAVSARLLVGAAMVVFGLAHFAYLDFTASMIPAWLPAHVPLACLTGACHLAAGSALLLGIVPALAVRLEAIMLSSFIVLVHVPAVIAHPGAAEQWTELFLAMALAGAMWIVYGSLGIPFRTRT
jgi:uncharacterized membrane protein